MVSEIAMIVSVKSMAPSVMTSRFEELSEYVINVPPLRSVAHRAEHTRNSGVKMKENMISV
jgi:hypothetical protein